MDEQPSERSHAALGVVLKWFAANEVLRKARAEEMELRLAAIAAVYPPDILEHTGAFNAELVDESVLKCVIRANAKVDGKKIKAALDKLRAIGADGVLLAERLVKWTPEASIAEFKKLTDKQRRIFKDVITVAGGAPSLELKPAE